MEAFCAFFWWFYSAHLLHGHEPLFALMGVFSFGFAVGNLTLFAFGTHYFMYPYAYEPFRVGECLCDGKDLCDLEVMGVY